MIKMRLLVVILLTAIGVFCSTLCYADLPTVTVLHTFAPGGPGDMTPSHDINPGGSHPEAPLLQGPDGALYGTTTTGGTHGTGVIFKINVDGTGYVVLHSFGSLARLFVNETNSDGCYPTAALVSGKDGTLYGAASQGGPGGSGTVFRLNSDGSGFALLHSFEATGEMFHNRGGASPLGLTLGPDLALYGVAELGGDGRGLLFKLSLDGKSFRVLHSFSDPEYDGTANINEGGAIPSAAVVIGHDGSLNGAANIGGKYGDGVIYKIGPDGKHFAVLHNFRRKDKANGAFPNGSLTLGTDNFLYGCTRQGGSADGGIAYKMNADGTAFTVLHIFSDPFAESLDGWSPSAPVFGNDGRLYGVSGGTGEDGHAELFKTTTDGAKFYLMHDFTNEEGQGASAGLILARDGNLYGISTSGGANKSGTIFQITFPATK